MEEDEEGRKDKAKRAREREFSTKPPPTEFGGIGGED
jgi:hypothetical protein